MQRILIVIILLFALTAHGQQKLSAELNFNTAKTQYNDTTAHVRNLSFKMAFPITALKKSWLSGNISYSSEAFHDFPAAYGADVEGIALGLSWTRVLGTRHLLVLSGDVGIYSDFKSVSSDAIREGLGLTYFTRYSSHFSLGLGVMYKNQFYGNQIVPVIVVMYTSNNDAHWKFSGLLPYNPRLTYQVNKKNGVSLEIRQVFSSYLLSAPENSGDYIKNRKLTTMLNYEYSFSQSWRLHAGVGYAAKQQYELYNKAEGRGWYLINTALGTKPAPVESISHGGVQFTIGIALNPKF